MHGTNKFDALQRVNSRVNMDTLDDADNISINVYVTEDDEDGRTERHEDRKGSP